MTQQHSDSGYELAETVSGEEDGAAIDFLGLLRRNRRGILVLTAVVGLCAAGAVAIVRALPPVDVVVSMDITPTFLGARDGRYPNKAPYSPQDIVANGIVEPIWRSQGLESMVPLDRVCRNLQVVAGGQEVEQVRSEFVQKLSNSKLTSAERTALEAEFAARMKAMNSASLTISLSGLEGALTGEQMARLVAAVPAEWARSVDATGGCAYDYPIPQGRELRASAVAAGKSATATGAVVHAERLKEFSDSLQRATEALAKLPGSAGVKDPSGSLLVDLVQELGSTRRNLVIPAYVDALAQARTQDPAGYAAIRSTRRRQLDSELSAAKERSRVLQDAFASYASDAPRRAPRGEGGRDPAPSAEGGSGIVANVDGSFIDRVIEQAVKSRNVEYQRELSDRIVAAELEVVELQQREEFESWLEDELLAERTVTPAAAEATRARLADLTDRLADCAERTRAIMGTLAMRNLNPASAMFRVDSAPVVVSERIVTTRTIALAGFGAWAIGVAAVIAIGARRQRDPANMALGATGNDLRRHVAGAVAELPERSPPPRRLPSDRGQPVA